MRQSIPGLLACWGLALNLAAIPCQAQSGRTVRHAEGGLVHSLWIPGGYEEVWWPESPQHRFGDAYRQSFAEMGIPAERVFAVLVRKKDLDAYYRGGDSPMGSHYIYIEWKPQARMPPASETADQMARAGGPPAHFKEALAKGDQATAAFFSRYLVKGAITPLGILREWKDGYISAMAIGLELKWKGQIVKSAKILNWCYQGRANGYYTVNYVILQQPGQNFSKHLEQMVAITQSMNNNRSGT